MQAGSLARLTWSSSLVTSPYRNKGRREGQRQQTHQELTGGVLSSAIQAIVSLGLRGEGGARFASRQALGSRAILSLGLRGEGGARFARHH